MGDPTRVVVQGVAAQSGSDAQAVGWVFPLGPFQPSYWQWSGVSWGWTMGSEPGQAQLFAVAAAPDGTYWAAAGRLHLLFGLTLISNALLTASARLQVLYVGRAGPARRVRRGRFSLLPYVAVAATEMLLVGVLVTDGLAGAAWAVVGGTIVSSGLVVARQVLALVEGERLLEELDETVYELRRALRERDRFADRLRDLAFHDPLTGLANRALFTDRLRAELEEPGEGGPPTLLLVDLDDFKPVNDRLGHAAGDRVLVLVGERMRACVGEDDLVARLGGDEFALVVRGPVPRARQVAERVLVELSRPFRLTESSVAVGASVGLATPSAADVGPGALDDLLHRADLALYRAKADGGNACRSDDPTASVGSSGCTPEAE